MTCRPSDGDRPKRPSEGGHGRRPLDAAAGIQVVLLGVAALVYFAVRGITEGSHAEADAHARAILRLEQWLHLDLEIRAQQLVLDHRALSTLANWIYIWGHWPVIVVTMAWLHHGHRDQYRRLRMAFFVSGAIGLVTFAVLPVAPPRLVGDAFVDTVTRWSRSYRVLQPPALVNRYAAMPSLHVGWNLILAVVVFRTTRRTAARVATAALPLAMAFAVVATGNHFVLDAVAGATVALFGLAVADHVENARRRPTTARADAGATALGAAPGRAGVTRRSVVRRAMLADRPRHAAPRGRR
jgi:hypothetical protein